jgi:hypothetical protein
MNSSRGFVRTSVIYFIITGRWFKHRWLFLLAEGKEAFSLFQRWRCREVTSCRPRSPTPASLSRLSSSSRLAYRYRLLLRGTSLSSPTQRAPPAQSLLDYFICSHAGSSLVTNQSTACWKIYNPDCRRNSTYCFSLHSTECMMPTLLSIILVVSVILNGKGINV